MKSIVCMAVIIGTLLLPSLAFSEMIDLGDEVSLERLYSNSGKVKEEKLFVRGELKCHREYTWFGAGSQDKTIWGRSFSEKVYIAPNQYLLRQFGPDGSILLDMFIKDKKVVYAQNKDLLTKARIGETFYTYKNDGEHAVGINYGKDGIEIRTVSKYKNDKLDGEQKHFDEKTKRFLTDSIYQSGRMSQSFKYDENGNEIPIGAR
jgi:antitoxin component YwqK of YwqJK toxin-antitoxin module